MSVGVNVSGAWKDVNAASVRVSGAWKNVEQAYVKVSGVWKPLLSTAPFLIGSVNSSAFTSNTKTLSHTTTADTAGLIVLVHGYDYGAGGTPTLTSVTFDGVSLTPDVSVVSAYSNYDCRTAVCRLFSPGAKTADVVVTFSAGVSFGSVQVFNVGSVSALDTSGNDTTVTPLQVALTTTAPTIQFGAAMGILSGTPTFTWSTGVVETLDASPSVNFAYAAGYRLGAAAESYTFVATPNATLLAGNLAVAAYR